MNDDKKSMKMDKYPRDLLERFFVSTTTTTTITQTQQIQNTQHHQHQYRQYLRENQEEEDEEEEEDEGIELNLGLSLGGRFGVDKHANNKKLTRSSSVVGTMPLLREDIAAAAGVASPTPAYPTLIRSSSLPTETEEEWRKRKELQTLRRMEAKRRRSEKQRVSKSDKDSTSTAAGATGGGGSEEIEGSGVTMGLNRSTVGAAPPPFNWANATTKQVVLGDVLGKGKIGVGFQGLFTQPSSQGSVDSQGGSSSSLSEMDSKPFLGSSSCGEIRSPASNQSLQERSSQDAVGSSGGPKTNENLTRTTSRTEVMENASKRPYQTQNIGKEIGTNSVEDMPCVFTKGDGPNGRRIEGILYKYGKGEEVRIMCVCHGNFLSPAEFVKHAGGGDVAHPLRHIVVNPSAAPFL
ncbi:putative ethylene-responsive binding factor-associated repression, Ninja family [Medicago truncatula]|uniref:Ninja-family protein n=1 Tax=Medicago truncatula TaxID=3880 RepID=A0A396HQH1_MEDTR|nr:ninja-family protein AFP1 [Medicago truncatula]RHN55592.1 putative ethylene-responsive binding factor-associated repression, Ninja family [Medicago truncatula]